MTGYTQIRRSLTALVLALVLTPACTKGGPTVDRVQPNLVDKEIFEGEWWVAQTVIEADHLLLRLGAQNCYWEEQGAYTGEVSPLMLAALSVSHVIVGHSEW